MEKEDRKFLKNFGKKLRKRRKKHGWTLEDCEENGYPSCNHLQKIETGRKNITLLTIKNLARLYNIPIRDLF